MIASHSRFLEHFFPWVMLFIKQSRNICLQQLTLFFYITFKDICALSRQLLKDAIEKEVHHKRYFTKSSLFRVLNLLVGKMLSLYHFWCFPLATCHKTGQCHALVMSPGLQTVKCVCLQYVFSEEEDLRKKSSERCTHWYWLSPWPQHYIP